MQEIVNASCAVGLFAAIGEIRFVKWTHNPRIGGDDQSTLGIERLRHLFERDIAGPLVVVCVSGNGHLAMPLLSNRHSRGHHVSDISLDIRINRVLPRTPYSLHGFAELLPVVGFAKPVVAVGEPPWFRCGPAHCVSFVSLAMDNRPVSPDGNTPVPGP